MNSNGRIALHPGFVLHRRPYRDTSLLLDVLTLEYGRVGLVARGARSPRSALQGVLQPFQSLLLSWTTRGELGTLTSAELSGMPHHLRGKSLISGFYLNELLMRLLQRHDPAPGLFACYADTVERLAAQRDDAWALRLFEKALLQELGYGLSLACEAHSGEPVREEIFYCYYPEHGPEPCTGECGAAGVRVSGRSLLALEGEGIPDHAILNETKRLMRVALNVYLGNQPLASRDLYRSAFGAPSTAQDRRDMSGEKNNEDKSSD